jgi:hypothetical protein
MAGTGERSSDQGAVWRDIDRKLFRLKSSSSTQAMGAMFEDHSRKIEEYVGAFKADPRQTGALFAISGKIVGLDLFDTPATLTKMFSKLLRSYALDAIDDHAPASSVADTNAFLSLLKDSKQDIFKAIGEGDDIRISASGLTGAALVARGRVIHLAAFTC